MRNIKLTEDGSSTLCWIEKNETFHSIHGAISESKHIFIEAGLDYSAQNKRVIKILEVGYGTGLNALLSSIYSIENSISLHYTALEAYPVSLEEHKILNYGELLNSTDLFNSLFDANWEKFSEVAPGIHLCKKNIRLENFQSDSDSYHLIYFDAFSPESQSELWSEAIFRKLFLMMEKNAVLVTYSCKGVVKRTLKNIGFSIEKLPGPPGKREFLRATKL